MKPATTGFGPILEQSSFRYDAMMHAESRKSPFILRRLAAPDAIYYRDIRLAGLRSHPEAFSSSWEDEVSRPMDWFAERLECNAIFGAHSCADPALTGVVGLLVPPAEKLKHKGVLWGMFVQPECQGAGLGTALVARVIEHAAKVVEEVRLTVVASNTAAVRLYTRAGFEQYGLERRALKVRDDYYDDLLMALRLSRPASR
jgi:ribosomal protein S18 acetylase RimI-like enzyme